MSIFLDALARPVSQTIDSPDPDDLDLFGLDPEDMDLLGDDDLDDDLDDDFGLDDDLDDDFGLDDEFGLDPEDEHFGVVVTAAVTAATLSPIVATGLTAGALGAGKKALLIQAMPYMKRRTLQRLKRSPFRGRKVKNAADGELRRRNRGGKRMVPSGSSGESQAKRKGVSTQQTVATRSSISQSSSQGRFQRGGPSEQAVRRRWRRQHFQQRGGQGGQGWGRPWGPSRPPRRRFGGEDPLTALAPGYEAVPKLSYAAVKHPFQSLAILGVAFGAGIAADRFGAVDWVAENTIGRIW